MVNPVDELLLAVAEADPDVPTLDVHGYTADAARREVDFFLHRSFQRGEKVVKIVHGSGQGILADELHRFIGHHVLVRSHRSSFLAGEAGSVLYVVLVDFL